MKRTIALLLVLCTLFSFVACSSPETPANDQPQHTHSFGEWTLTKKATCTESGEQERVCSCGEKQTQTVAATGHSFGAWIVTKAPTCTEIGEQERTCSCGEIQNQMIAATGHSFGAWIVTKAPTCTETGEQERTCTCEEKQTQTIAAKGHSFGEWTVSSEPTCTKEGNKTRNCSVCGTVENEAIPATGHSWNEATCTEPKTCSVCHATEGAALGHNYTDGVCSRCGSKQLPKIVFKNTIPTPTENWILYTSPDLGHWITKTWIKSMSYEYDNYNNLIITFSADGTRYNGYCLNLKMKYALTDKDGNVILSDIYKKSISDLPGLVYDFHLENERIKIFNMYIPFELDTIYFKLYTYWD